MENPETTTIKSAARTIELVTTIQQAIDRNYRRLCEAAKADWERLFRGKDASGIRINVRVHPQESVKRTLPLPGSAFLKSRRPPEARRRGKRSRGFAH